MLPVRVFFEKKGCAAYISHLDVQRAVIRALLRTGYSLAFTEGFNPHLKLVFAMPLSLFQESTYEIFDFTVLNDGVSYDDVLKRLCEVFPGELRPLSAAAPVKKLSTLRAASYDIFTASSEALLSTVLPESGMTVMKKGKNGITETDIRPLIKDFAVEALPDGAVMHVRCDCGSQSHLNVAYLCDWLGIAPEDCTIVRTGLYDDCGELLK